jgi:hypothetical protein
MLSPATRPILDACCRLQKSVSQNRMGVNDKRPEVNGLEAHSVSGVAGRVKEGILDESL